MSISKQFKKFDFFTEVEANIIQYAAGRSSVRNREGFKAEDLRGLIVQSSSGRPYGCNSSVATILNNALRDLVVRGLATRVRENCLGRPYVYIFAYGIIKAIAGKLNSIENFGLKVQEQVILKLVNKYNETNTALTQEDADEITHLKTVLYSSEYFTRQESSEGDVITVTFVPTKLAQSYYKRWCEIVEIYASV